MNVVVAPDSFKGSLTSIQVSRIIETSILDINANYNVVVKPMADGGEGTLQALLTSKQGDIIPITCTGPLGNKIDTTYAIIESSTAIIECASIAGLVQVPTKQRNPDFTTTFGIGEVIIDALNKGCTSFVIGLGGSATNDGGLGMLQALGMRTQNEYTEHLFGKDLHNITKIDLSKMDPRLAEVDIKIACDVENPLCGENGASEIYGRQKGATQEQIEKYDLSLDKYSDLIQSEINASIKEVPGSGAAGGLGFAFLVLGANLVSGAKLLADAMDLEDAIKNADLVITGEGKSDEQTLYGKAPGYTASLATKHNVPAVLISGSLQDLDKLTEKFVACFSIINRPLTLHQAIENADSLLYEQTKQVFLLFDYFYSNKALKYT